MDIKDYINKVNNLKNDLPNRLQNEVYPQVIETTLNRFKTRIFIKGLDSNGNEIGSYSEKPISVPKKAFVKKSSFAPSSKSGKTMGLKNGYKELKEVQGLKSEKVNLVYTGDLKESVTAQKKGTGYAVGFSDKNNSKKANQLEQKYSKDIFQFSEDEKLKMTQNLATELRKIHKAFFYAR